MDGVDQSDDLTFRVNFGGDGVSKLRDRVKDKLKEFMGDYTDDTLVEYVIVLLKNGRRKVEARNELNVFLGDDSDSFVSWLWDHLGSNLDLYVQSKDSCPNEVVKTKSMSREPAGRIDSHHLDSETEREKPNKLSRSRHGREWKGLVKNADEPPPLRSAVTANFHVEEATHLKVDQAKRSPSPRPKFQRKRRPDERPQMKREEGSKTTINAPRRLLQFAVRDAVGSPRPSSLGTEPSLKRLRSVVSTSTGDSSLADRPQRISSVARAPNATMAVAIKAVAEAAKDVVKVRSLGNVFDRLGRGMDVSGTTDHMAEFREAPVEGVEEYRDFDYIAEETQSTYLQQSDYSERYARNRTVIESDTGIASDFVSDNEVYEGGNILGRRAMDVSRTGTSKNDDSLMVQYSGSNKADESMRKPWKDQDQLAADNTSSKIVNISVNVNTWKPPHYQETREVSEVDGRKLVQGSEAGADKSGVRLMKENNHGVSVGNGNAVPATDGQRESQKALSSTAGLFSSGHPAEDTDSRTIFVSNVHFAATKDSLSRHFNKFGDVLKVVIVMDAATGQPKGSAYVEFKRKEAAEHALSLDGTSFMSRILKVVRKSAAPQEAAPVMNWPRISRGSIFAASRFGRVPFPRGMPGLYRARVPIKVGARSFQWKRDAQTSPTEITGVSNNSVPSPTTPRSLTYVRPEPKANGNSGTV